MIVMYEICSIYDNLFFDMNVIWFKLIWFKVFDGKFILFYELILL